MVIFDMEENRHTVLPSCLNCGAENVSGASFCSACGSSLEAAPTDSANVKKCSYCAKPLTGEDAYYFRCRYCGQDYCYEHRLPENHLCKSSPLRRNIPTSSNPYYTTGGGYYSSSSSASSGRGSTSRQRSGGGFSINISPQGRNLAILIGLGLVLGFAFSFIEVGGLPFYYYFLQINQAVLQYGWYWQLVTSIIIVQPSGLGLLDVFFNAISVVWLDRLFVSTYTRVQYWLVFFLTGIAGNLMSLLNGPGVVSFGASGGIFGLVAGAVTADYALNRRVNGTLLAWFVFIFIYSSFAGSVDLFAHLGGALAGLVAGYVIGRSRRAGRGYY
jgi:rhomboid protease GluP